MSLGDHLPKIGGKGGGPWFLDLCLTAEANSSELFITIMKLDFRK